ncbi:MAG: hypothetical protein AAF235_07955 [Planctomycetota bacterium]
MHHDTNTPRASADDRFAIAAAADSAARANRPVTLVVLAGVFLTVAVLFTLLAYRSYADAQRTARLQQARTERLLTLAVDHAAWTLAADQENPDSPLCSPEPRLTSQIQNKAIALGLQRPGLPSEDDAVVDGVRRRTLRYTIAERDLTKVLAFIEAVQNDIGCLEVFRLDIEPVNNERWTVDVSFQRLERAEP